MQAALLIQIGVLGSNLVPAQHPNHKWSKMWKILFWSFYPVPVLLMHQTHKQSVLTWELPRCWERQRCRWPPSPRPRQNSSQTWSQLASVSEKVASWAYLLNVCQADNKVTEGLAMANWIFKSLLIGQYTYVEYWKQIQKRQNVTFCMFGSSDWVNHVPHPPLPKNRIKLWSRQCDNCLSSISALNLSRTPQLSPLPVNNTERLRICLFFVVHWHGFILLFFDIFACYGLLYANLETCF